MNRLSLSEKEFLEKTAEIVRENLENPQFGVSELAGAMGMSRSNLHRKIHKISKISASKFIQQVRLKRALELLQQTSLNVSEVSWNVGFHSISYFVKCFREYYGFPPGEVGNRKENDIDIRKSGSSVAPRRKVWLITSVVLILIIAVYGAIKLYNTRTLSAVNSTIKTIAVLPLKNDSRDSSNVYFINGLQDAIIANLSNVDGITVRSRTTVEKYRDTQKTIPEIAAELDVEYIIEGSGQKYENLVVLNIQILDAVSDRLLFSKQYRKEVENVKDFIDLQSEIALNTIAEIKEEIQPEKIKLRYALYTQNFEALKYYLKGSDLATLSAWHEDAVRLTLESRNQFKKAVQLDSTFIEAMIQLGWMYHGLHYRIPPPQNYLDSAFYYARKVLEIDDTYNQAYNLLSILYFTQGNYDKAMENYQIAIKYGDETQIEKAVGGGALAQIYYEKGEYSKAIELRYKELYNRIEHRRTIDYYILNHLFQYLNEMGFIETSNMYSKWILQINNDSVGYYYRLIENYFKSGNFDSIFKIVDQHAWLDSFPCRSWYLPMAYLKAKNYEKAHDLFESLYSRFLQVDDPDIALASIYMINGQKQKADSILWYAVDHHTVQIERWCDNEASDFHRIWLACAYAMLDEKRQAYKTLHRIKHFHLFFQACLKYMPMFDTIRDEPEFQEILNRMEGKYRTEHEKTGELLRELGEI